MDQLEKDCRVARMIMEQTATTHYVSRIGHAVSRMYILVPESNTVLVAFGPQFQNMDDEEINLYVIELRKRMAAQE